MPTTRLTKWHLLYSARQQAGHIEEASETFVKPHNGYRIIGTYSGYEAALSAYQQFFKKYRKHARRYTDKRNYTVQGEWI